jgi:predicted Zn-dependent protease with MMP-like domain
LIFGRHNKLDVQTTINPRCSSARKKSVRTVASGRRPGQICTVNLNWKKLCAAALAEVEVTVSALPKPLRERAEKLPVTFERQPNADLQADGIEPDTLGLFAGSEFADEGNVPLPPQIILFLENLWDFAEGDEVIFREEVRTTFLHELGHYLGLDEDEIAGRGLE